MLPLAEQNRLQSCLAILAFNAKGTRLAACGESQHISIWDTSSGLLTQTLPSGPDISRAIVFGDSDQRLFVANYGSNAIEVWDLATNQQLSPLQGHTAHVRSLVVSSDGSTVASGGKDGTMRIWRANDGDLLRTWKAHNLLVDCVAFRPGHREIATCGIDNLIRVWEIDVPTEVPRSSGHTDRVNEIAFTPDGKWIASASKDGTIRLWDAETTQAGPVCFRSSSHGLGSCFLSQRRVADFGSRRRSSITSSNGLWRRNTANRDPHSKSSHLEYRCRSNWSADCLRRRRRHIEDMACSSIHHDRQFEGA